MLFYLINVLDNNILLYCEFGSEFCAIHPTGITVVEIEDLTFLELDLTGSL